MDLSDIRLVVVTPIHYPLWHSNYCKSILDLYTASIQIGLDLTVTWIEGESDIVRARNSGVQRFLGTDGTHLLWIDSDIGFTPKAVARLLLSGYELVGAVYHKKDDDAGFASDPRDVGEVDEEGFAPIKELPNGFMLVARRVFAEIGKIVDNDNYYATGYYDGRYETEDYAFCRRWRECGGSIYVDTQTQLTHQGMKLYTGNFAEAVMRAKK